MNRPLLLALFALWLLAACRREGEEDLGLGLRAKPSAVDLDGLTRPGGLERVLSISPSAVDARLGPHERKQQLRLAMTSGPRTEELTENWETEVDGHGALRALHRTSRGDVTEWFLVKGKLYSRAQTARFGVRDPQGDEVKSARELQDGVLPGLLAVIGRFARREEATAAVGTRTARRVTLSLASSPDTLDDSDPAHAWRRSLRVSALSGEALLDTTSGATLRARLDAKYQFMRENKEITVELHFASETSDIGRPRTILPPAEAVGTLARPRPLLDRTQLLDGLVVKH